MNKGKTPGSNIDCGIHRLPASDADLRSVSAARGYTWIDMSLSAAADKAELLRRFDDALKCPPGFGHNWDALADALQDLSWLPGQGAVIAFRDVDVYARRCPGDWNTLRSILDESVDFWRRQRRTFMVLLDAGHHSSWEP